MTWVKATGEHELTFHGADGSTPIVQLADPIKLLSETEFE